MKHAREHHGRRDKDERNKDERNMGEGLGMRGRVPRPFFVPSLVDCGARGELAGGRLDKLLFDQSSANQVPNPLRRFGTAVTVDSAIELADRFE